MGKVIKIREYQVTFEFRKIYSLLNRRMPFLIKYSLLLMGMFGLYSGTLVGQTTQLDSLVVFEHPSGYQLQYPASWWPDRRGASLLLYLVPKDTGSYSYPVEKFSVIIEKNTENQTIQDFISAYKKRTIAVYRNYGVTFNIYAEDTLIIDNTQSWQIVCGINEWDQQKMIWAIPGQQQVFLLEFTARSEIYDDLLLQAVQVVQSFRKVP